MKIGLMLFGMKDDFKRILAKMASDYIGPAGLIPFERLVTRHLGFLQELRARGLTWEQISRLLAGAGIVHRNGRPFSVSHLRGVFGRRQKRATESASVNPLESATAAPAPPMARLSKTGRRQAGHKKSKTAEPGEGAFVGDSTDPLPADARNITGDGDLQGDDYAGGRPAANTPLRDRADVLALMRQAALARRSA